MVTTTFHHNILFLQCLEYLYSIGASNIVFTTQISSTETKVLSVSLSFSAVDPGGDFPRDLCADYVAPDVFLLSAGIPGLVGAQCSGEF